MWDASSEKLRSPVGVYRGLGITRIGAHGPQTSGLPVTGKYSGERLDFHEWEGKVGPTSLRGSLGNCTGSSVVWAAPWREEKELLK